MTSDTARFGPYELVRRLGAGGMAETFVAVRRGPGGFEQRVCLKRPLPAYEDNPELIEMFMEEARISGRLRHANIVSVLDYGEAEGTHYLALELVEGMDLRGLLRALRDKDERLDPDLVAYIAFELARALQHAHDAGDDATAEGVIHRDISPGNVLISDEGEVKLTDFGIAKAADGAGLTRTGIVKGKASYMAPEYARTGQIDARGDLFALGVTLYECLSGERPYDGATDVDTFDRSSAGRFTPLAEHAPSAPAALRDIVERLINPDPEARFVNAGALLDALEKEAPPADAARRLAQVIRSHRPPVDRSTPVVRAAPGWGGRSSGSGQAGASGSVTAIPVSRGRMRLVPILVAVLGVLIGVAIALLGWQPPQDETARADPSSPVQSGAPPPDGAAKPDAGARPASSPDAGTTRTAADAGQQAREAGASAAPSARRDRPPPAPLSDWDRGRIADVRRLAATCWVTVQPATGQPSLRTTAIVSVNEAGIPGPIDFRPPIPAPVRGCIIMRAFNFHFEATRERRQVRIPLTLQPPSG